MYREALLTGENCKTTTGKWDQKQNRAFLSLISNSLVKLNSCNSVGILSYSCQFQTIEDVETCRKMDREGVGWIRSRNVL